MKPPCAPSPSALAPTNLKSFALTCPNCSAGISFAPSTKAWFALSRSWRKCNNCSRPAETCTGAVSMLHTCLGLGVQALHKQVAMAVDAINLGRCFQRHPEYLMDPPSQNTLFRSSLAEILEPCQRRAPFQYI